MSDDKKPRITSFAFSKEFFNDPTFSSFLFDNKDLMNIDFDKLDSNSGNSQSLDKDSTSPNNSSSYEGQTIFGSHRRYSNKNGVTTYHLSSPLSSPENNHINKQPIEESNDTANYYNIINAIKRENINNINNNKNAGIFDPSNSYSTSPPISPLPYNINNQKFYKNTQQSYSAVELTKPDQYTEDQKSSKSVKDYSMSGSGYSNKRRSKSLHNVSQSYEDESFEFIDGITDYSFSQKENSEPSEVTTTTTTSEKEKKGHTRSLSKTLKRAVSRNTRKTKKNHRKEISFSSKSKDNKVPDVPPIPQEFNDNTLVFKPSSGAIASYGDVTSNDNGFDFESMISSDQTRKISLTPNRMNEIQRHQQLSANRLKPKNYERENLVPVNIINSNNGKNNNFGNMNIEDYDSDDSIDRLLNEGKPKRKQETLWEFLKNSSPEDYMGKNKADAITGNSSNNTQANPSKPVNNAPQPKYIPIEIKYSPFDKMDNSKTNNDSNKNGLNYNVVNNNNLNFNSVNNNSINFNNMNFNNVKNTYVQTLPYHKKPLNENKVSYSSATLPISKRSTSKKNNTEDATSPSAQSMKLAQTISNIAKTPDSSSTDGDYSSTASIQPPVVQTEEQKQPPVPPKPEMVSVGTQWYISDASLMRKKKVLFRPVDRRNPIAKYMFNHAFVENIYVSNEDIKKRRAHVQEVIPQDFLARNFYYYSRYPSSVPPVPKSEMVSQGTETENDDNVDDVKPEVINHSVEVINDYIDDSDSLNNEDKTESTDEATLTSSDKKEANSKKEEMEREVKSLYSKKEREVIVNTLFNKIIHYLEANPEKQKENNKTQEFAKLMFKENTKLQKELTKLRSELSAERVLRETAEEELTRYRTLMQSTLLNDN